VYHAAYEGTMSVNISLEEILRFLLEAPMFGDLDPTELAEVVRAQGYSDIRYHWYNYHPAYPMIADRVDPMEYRRAQVAMEHEGTWRGMFLCSAGIIEAVKDPA